MQVQGNPPKHDLHVYAGWLLAAVLIMIGLPFSFRLLITDIKIATSYESVPFDVTTETDENLLAGVRFTKTPGKNGIKQIKTKIWLGEGDRAEKQKIVYDSVIEAPENEIVVEGRRQERDAEDDAKNALTGYMNAWQGGDYATLTSVSVADSLKGFKTEQITASYQATGEVLESFTVGAANVVSMEQLLTGEDGSSGSSSSSYSSGDDDEDKPMAAESFPARTWAAAEVTLDYTTNSKASGKSIHHEKVHIAYVEGEWRIIYFGQLAGIATNQVQEITHSSYGDKKLSSVALDYVIVYPEHTLLVVHETNTSPASRYGGSSVNSVFSSLTSYSANPVMTDDTAGLTYVVNEDKTSEFESYVKEGKTQAGFIYVEPGVPADATTLMVSITDSYSLPDIYFNAVSIK